jgi:dTDP-4-dehydrorhamnose 3,5-epimerase
LPFTLTKSSPLPGVLVVSPTLHPDGRGTFFELYKQSEYRALGIDDHFVQDNFSHSVAGVVRGLHFQFPPSPQAKLVSVVHGRILDAIVDIRRGSPAYGRSFSIELSSENRKTLYVPEGFAHGFAVLSAEADVLYKVTGEFDPDAEGGIRWNDPALAIAWPLANPIVSPRDAALPTLAELDNKFVY